MTMKSIRKNKASTMKDNINGTFLVAIFMAASLVFLGAGLVVASQDDQITDTARAPPTGYYTTIGPDGIPVHSTPIDPSTELPPVKELVTTDQGGMSGYNSGISHV